MMMIDNDTDDEIPDFFAKMSNYIRVTLTPGEDWYALPRDVCVMKMKI
jgi:hypothetical protein